jgi:hypothetical protein
MAFIGVIDPLNPRIETPEEVRDALLEASKWIPKDQLGATDDCGLSLRCERWNKHISSLLISRLPLGFSSFSIDDKPKYGGPDSARDIAFQKITNRVKGVMMARTLLALGAGGLI